MLFCQILFKIIAEFSSFFNIPSLQEPWLLPGLFLLVKNFGEELWGEALFQGEALNLPGLLVKLLYLPGSKAHDFADGQINIR